MLPGGTHIKPGDELALGPQIVKVKRVTLTGQIVLTNGERYDRTGQQIGGSKSKSFRRELSPITDELRAKIAAEKARASHIAYREDLDWKEFDDAPPLKLWKCSKKLNSKTWRANRVT